MFYVGRKEGNVLFNDALNTFYLRLYGIRHMVKDHSDSEKGNQLLPHRLLSFRLTARALLYAPSDRQDSTYHSLCYTSCGALSGTRNSCFMLVSDIIISNGPLTGVNPRSDVYTVVQTGSTMSCTMVCFI